MEIQGSIKVIGEVQEISPTFKKRELVVSTNEQYPQKTPLTKKRSLIEFYLDTIINSDLLFFAYSSFVHPLLQSISGSTSPLPIPVIRLSSIPFEITY